MTTADTMSETALGSDAASQRVLFDPEVFRALRRVDATPQERGRIFERVMRVAFERNPQYGDRFKQVWLWSHWPDRQKFGYGADAGIDLVAAEHDGGVCAIQCKLYSPGAKVPSGDIDSFLAEAGKEPFTSSLLVNTGELTTQSWSKVHNATKRCEVLSGFVLDQWPVRWSECFDDPDKVQFAERAEPRVDQQEALDKIAKGFQEYDRGQLRMPCGTGKSLVSLWAAEQQVGRGGRVLYLVPSIALMAQTMRVWAFHRELPHGYGAVCSDVTAGRNADAKKSELAELLAPPSTNREQIASTMQTPVTDEAMQVWFCTYQSVPLLARVLSEHAPDVVFDLVVCDEAHRTTGIGSATKEKSASAFVLAHDNEHVPALKRLYQTATPRVFTERQRRKLEELGAAGDSFSMDNESIFGPVFYEMTFVEAIERELVSDYRVLVVGVNEKEAAMAGAAKRVTEITASDLARKAKVNSDYATKLLGCWDAMATPESQVRAAGTVAGEIPVDSEHRHLRTAIAFTNTVRSSQACSEQGYFAAEGFEGRLWEAITRDVQEANPGRDFLELEVEHVDGNTRAVARTQALSALERQSQDTTGPPRCRVISNAQLFTEGVDVPALDAVVFLEPKRSPVQVTQAVGRAMRKAEGKNYGYVVIPVIVPEGCQMTDAEVLDGSDFKTVWEVVRALRSHDERVDYWVNDPRVASPIILHPNSHDDPEIVTDEEIAEQGILHLQFVKKLEEAVASKIVQECGDKQMWPTWGQRAAEVCKRVERQTASLIAEPTCKAAFDEFVAAMREAVGAHLTPAAAQQMVAHHVVTIPVFDHLFADARFAARNPISRAINRFLDALAQAHAPDTADPDASSADQVFGDLLIPLARSYRTMQRMLEDTHDAAETVDLLRQIYEGFFAHAMSDTVSRLGIVYTPVEIVDFMLRSADAACRKHFGHGLTAENVHVLDPFTGTGTFLHRLLTAKRSDGEPLIEEDDLRRKYSGKCNHGTPAVCNGESIHENCTPPELHANEIVLLAYYIAALKIEAAAAERGIDADYRQYRGIVFGDTFNSNRTQGSIPGFDDNSARARTQNKLPIRVIIANPPWSAGQKSAGDDNPNIKYPEIEQRVRDTYGKQHKMVTGVGMGPAAGDLYIEALRWASDRIQQTADGEEKPGIIALVHPNSLSSAPSLTGARAALRDEFSDIYVINLRGDARKSGDERQAESDNVFDQHSRNGVQVTVLVRDPDRLGPDRALLHYAEVPPYTKLDEKIRWLRDLGDTGSNQFEVVPVNDRHHWVNITDGSFDELLLVCASGKSGDMSAVSRHELGVKTNLDPYVYSFSRNALIEKVKRLIEAYEAAREQYAERGASLDTLTRNNNPRSIRWTAALKQALKRKDKIEFSPDRIRKVLYRPFVTLWLYDDNRILAQSKAATSLFPDAEREKRRFHRHYSAEQPSNLRSRGESASRRPTSGRNQPTVADHSTEAILVTSPSNMTFQALALDTVPDIAAIKGSQQTRVMPRRRSW